MTKFQISTIPTVFEVEAENIDQAMIAISTYTGSNNIRPVLDHADSAFADLVDLDDKKVKKLRKFIDKHRPEILVAIETIKVI